MKKVFRKILKVILSKIIQIEVLEVYDLELKKTVKAEYVSVFGKYVKTIYN